MVIMVNRLFTRAAFTALFCTAAALTANAQTYDTNATSVVSSGISNVTSTTVGAAVVGGYTGGGVGSTPSIFTDTQTGSSAEQLGLSAGGKESRLGVWINGAYSHVDQDQSAIESDGDIYALATGADWRFSERLLAGVSLGYENSDIDTKFNQGNLDTDGFFIAPYAAFQLFDNIFVDATVSYSDLDTDSKRTSGGAQVTGKYDSTRWFGAVNATAQFVRGKLTILPGIGWMYTRSKFDSYTESNAATIASSTGHLGRIRGGARLQYQITPTIAPYAFGDIEYDYKRDDISVAAGQTQPSDEDTGGVLGGGAVFKISDSVRGSVEGSTVVGRSDYNQYNLSANLRFRF